MLALQNLLYVVKPEQWRLKVSPQIHEMYCKVYMERLQKKPGNFGWSNVQMTFTRILNYRNKWMNHTGRIQEDGPQINDGLQIKWTR